MDADKKRCAQCGEVIGVYEPVLVAFDDGTMCEGSLLTVGDALDRPGTAILHEACGIGGGRPGGE
jgi:hypothetical protein